MLRTALDGRADDVFDRSYTRDGIFCENAELERKGAREFAVKIDGAAAHAGDDACSLDLGAFELDKDDGLARPKKIGHDPDYFEVELFNLVAGEDGVRVALHASPNLVEPKYLTRLCGGGGRKNCNC